MFLLVAQGVMCWRGEMEVGERGREGWKGGGSGSVTIHVHPIHCHSIGCEGEREREAREGGRD